MKQTTVKFLAIVFLLHSFAGMRCESEYQNPKNIFEGEHVPGALAELISPKINWRLSDSLETFERIAVIDDGVDYTLGALRDRIAFQKTADGQVVGAGYDILDQDVWPMPKHIDARVFAFGARKITEQGKIVEPLENPLASIDKMNERFVAMFLEHIKSHQVLSKSLFTKLNKDNFTLLGSLILIQSELDLSRYRSIGDSDTESYFNLDSKDPALSDPSMKDPLNTYQVLVARPWSLSLEYGMPYVGYDRVMLSLLLQYVEHFDVFYESLQEVYQSFSEETGFQKMLDTYVDYLDRLRDGANLLIGGKNPQQTATILLAEKWLSHRFGIPVDKFGILQDSLLSFCNSYPENLRKKLLENTLSKDEERVIIFEHIDASLETYRKVDEAMVAASHATKSEKLEARKRLKSYEWFADFAKESATAHELELFTCRELNTGKAWQTTDKMKFFKRYYSAYFHKDQNDSQGTAVASVIAANSKNTKVLPIRVQANKTNQANKQLRTSAVRWVRDWNGWLSKPVVFAGVSALLERAIDFQWEFDSPEMRKVQVISLLSKVMRDDYLTNESPYEFVDQLQQAVEVVAREKIRVANISLADQTSIKADSLDVETLEVEKVFTFLRQEFLKTILAEKINAVAKDTIFVVSAGDSGGWLDGRARSALPCDLSSPYFFDFENSQNRLANNKLENILCVGALTRSGEIADFSNLTLTEVPFLFATGVEIPSIASAELCLGPLNDYLHSKTRKDWGQYSALSFYKRGELKAELQERTGIKDLEQVVRHRSNWPNFLVENRYNVACYEEVAAGKRLDEITEKGTAYSAALVSAKLAEFLLKSTSEPVSASKSIEAFLQELPKLQDGSILTEVPILEVAPKKFIDDADDRKVRL